ncbi:MAG: glycosyltransferase family 1 protein [Ktedonobacterales bacterium]
MAQGTPVTAYERGRPLHAAASLLRVAINAQLVSFGQSYRNAGVSRYTYTLLDGLGKLGGPFIYTAFVNDREASAAAASPLAHAETLRLVSGGWPTGNPAQRILWEQLALPGALRRVGADVFHSPVNVLPERLPCASVVTIHDLAFVRYPQYFRPTRRIYQQQFTRRSVRAATLIVAVSQSTKRDLVEAMQAPAERIRVIYPSIDGDFQPTADPATLAEFRARHDLPDRYLLFLGTLEPRKNLETLVHAYARLRSLLPDAPQLVLAGAKGWFYESLFARVRTTGMERYVTFAGYVSREEQPLWYAAATMFIYPSLYEGFGLPIVEALACGVPTLTSNVSSMPEAAGTVAIQVDPHDADGLAYAMRDALLDATLKARTARDGLAWARQFSAERMAQAYQDVYREAVTADSGSRGKRRVK